LRSKSTTPGPHVEKPVFAADDGVILHQPLSLHIFRKNGKKGLKMNGPPVCPPHFLQNAPTWRPQNTNFRPLFWA